MNLHNIGAKHYTLVILSFVIGVVASGVILRFIPNQAVKQGLICWFFMGVCFVPEDGFNNEWAYWIASPLLAFGRVVLSILRKLFD